MLRGAICVIVLFCCVCAMRANSAPTTQPSTTQPASTQPAATQASTQASELSERAGLNFVLDNLPERDVGIVQYEQTVKNVRLAFQTRRRAAWGDQIPDEIFLNYVLPHCNVTERRDDWREDFSRRFWPLVQSSRTASQAAMVLNEGISKLIKLRAAGTTPRAKPDPSPYETIQAGYASSSGLAILLVDMCRSVCVPARVVGTPAFVNPKKDQPPYHFWAEIWDGQWHVVSPGENKPLDQGWFLENCAQADPNNPRTCVYAVSYKKTATQFPIAWDETIKDVSGEDITYSYVKRIPVRLQVIDREDGMRILGHLTVKLRGRLIADSEIADPTVFMLSAGQKYEAIVRAIPGPTRTRAFTAPSERGWLLSLPVGD